MAHYVDGSLPPVPKKNLKAYQKLALKAAKVWKDHGALDYRECSGEDLMTKWGIPFPKLMKVKAGETIVFAYIVFKSKAHRNKVNAKVMKDPRLQCPADPKDMPFDCGRMHYGGFQTIVKA